MKYFSIFVLILCFTTLSIAQKSALKKQISLKESNISIENILSKIEKLCDYNFSYNSDLFINEKKFSINYRNKSIEFILNKVFGNKFQFIVIGNKIVIKKKKNISTSTIKFPIKKKKKIPDKIESKRDENLFPLKQNKINHLETNNLITSNIDSFLFPLPIDIKTKSRMSKIGFSFSQNYNLSNNHKSDLSMGVGGFFDYKLLELLDISIGLELYRSRIQNNNFDLIHLDNTELINPADDIERFYIAGLFMVDMPISLRLNLYNKNGFIFLSAGASSSYINILYDYFYDGERVKYGKYYRLAAFNILRLSCGYERKFKNSQNSSFQIEPFIKYSLENFSNENINLFYAGVSFRLNYFLPQNKF